MVSNYIKNNSPVHPKVLADPEKYGFESRKVMMLLYRREKYKDNELKLIEIWEAGSGEVVEGADQNDNSFR